MVHASAPLTCEGYGRLEVDRINTAAIAYRLHHREAVAPREVHALPYCLIHRHVRRHTQRATDHLANAARTTTWRPGVRLL